MVGGGNGCWRRGDVGNGSWRRGDGRGWRENGSLRRGMVGGRGMGAGGGGM